MVRAFAHGAMGYRIDPSWGGPIDVFLLTVIVIKLLSVNQNSVILDQTIVPGTESIEGIRPYPPHLY